MKQLTVLAFFLISSIFAYSQHLAPTMRVLHDKKWQNVDVTSTGQASASKKYTDSSIVYFVYASRIDSVNNEYTTVQSSNKDLINNVSNELKTKNIKFFQHFPINRPPNKQSYYQLTWSGAYFPTTISSIK